jgi:hypothetical protein
MTKCRVPYQILSGVILPPQIPRGRPKLNDDNALIVLAIDGLANGVFNSRNHAAVELSKNVKAGKRDALVKRLNRKLKTANID